MKRIVRILLCTMLAMLVMCLSGCRARIIDEPLPQSEVEPTPTPLTTPEPTPTPEPAPMETERIVFVEEGGEDTQREAVKVCFDANRGACSKSSMKVYYSSYYGELPEATRKGYSFVGWFTQKSGGTLITENSVVSVKEEHTLYAHWSQSAKFTLTLEPNGGRLKAGDTTRTIYKGEAYGGFPTPTRPGYDLEGWFTAAEGGTEVDGNAVFNGNGNVTLYAHWTYNPYEFWSFTRQNIGERMYSCQQKSIYIEFEEPDVTVKYCTLISNTHSQNVAANRDDMQVDDDWVRGKNPNVIIKCVGNMGNAAAYYSEMSARFPGYRILIVPSAAVYGSSSQQLYYELYLGSLLYPEWYDEVDIGAVGAELGVSGSIYG